MKPKKDIRGAGVSSYGAAVWIKTVAGRRASIKHRLSIIAVNRCFMCHPLCLQILIEIVKYDFVGAKGESAILDNLRMHETNKMKNKRFSQMLLTVSYTHLTLPTT